MRPRRRTARGPPRRWSSRCPPAGAPSPPPVRRCLRRSPVPVHAADPRCSLLASVLALHGALLVKGPPHLDQLGVLERAQELVDEPLLRALQGQAVFVLDEEERVDTAGDQGVDARALLGNPRLEALTANGEKADRVLGKQDSQE